jgi:hypothetical protein
MVIELSSLNLVQKIPNVSSRVSLRYRDLSVVVSFEDGSAEPFQLGKCELERLCVFFLSVIDV